MEYPSKNTSTYTAPTKNTSVIGTFPNQTTHTWATETMKWEEELRTWEDVATYTYQAKNI
jgi:hypothetical protein